MHTRTQEEGAVIPQETDPDVPMSIQESLVEVWSAVACCRVRGTEYSRRGTEPSEGGRH